MSLYFRTRDANSSINIMKLTQSWIEKQERPLCFHISSFTSSMTWFDICPLVFCKTFPSHISVTDCTVSIFPFFFKRLENT